MGTYTVKCIVCEQPFIWFSGNVFQICAECNPEPKVSYSSELPSTSSGSFIIPTGTPIGTPYNPYKIQNTPIFDNETVNICTYKLKEEAVIPTRSNSADAGLDLYALKDTFIEVGTTETIETGVTVLIPNGYHGRIADRSSMARKGLIVGAGVIDAGYNGDFSVVLHNFSGRQDSDNLHTKSGYQVKKGDKIAQLIISPVVTNTPIEINTLWNSDRGNKGWGSSGR